MGWILSYLSRSLLSPVKYARPSGLWRDPGLAPSPHIIYQDGNPSNDMSPPRACRRVPHLPIALADWLRAARAGCRMWHRACAVRSLPLPPTLPATLIRALRGNHDQVRKFGLQWVKKVCFFFKVKRSKVPGLSFCYFSISRRPTPFSWRGSILRIG